MASPISRQNHNSTKRHHFPIRIYYEDTDAGGIVYHANYLKFAERARTEFLRQLGHDHHAIMKEHSLFLVVRHMEIDYLAPAKLDDLLDVRTEVSGFGNTSIGLKQCVWRGEKMLAEMTVTVVAVTPAGKAIRIPVPLRQGFENYVVSEKNPKG